MIRVGYMVYSRLPEADKRTALPVRRRVAAVHVHENTPVMRIGHRRPGDAWLFSYLTLATGQPLFTLDKGWIRADEVSANRPAPSKLVTALGAAVDCVGKSCARATDCKDMGWIQLDAIDGEGSLRDYRLDIPIETGWLHDGTLWAGERYANSPLPDDCRTTTYSIEVEKHHTFYAGPHGLLMGDSTRLVEPSAG
jgi:hypothetical protein